MIRADPIVLPPRAPRKSKDNPSSYENLKSMKLAMDSPEDGEGDDDDNEDNEDHKNHASSRVPSYNSAAQPIATAQIVPMQPRPAIIVPFQKNKPGPPSNPRKHLPPEMAQQMLDDEFEHLPPSHSIPVLSDEEMHQLATATQQFHKDRVVKLISSLQEQLMEHQITLEMMENLERRNGQLASQVNDLQKEKAMHDEKVAGLEYQVVELKLNLATEKSQGDHNWQSIQQLKGEVQRLKKENKELWKTNMNNVCNAADGKADKSLNHDNRPRESKRHSMDHIHRSSFRDELVQRRKSISSGEPPKPQETAGPPAHNEKAEMICAFPSQTKRTFESSNASKDQDSGRTSPTTSIGSKASSTNSHKNDDDLSNRDLRGVQWRPSTRRPSSLIDTGRKVRWTDITGDSDDSDDDCDDDVDGKEYAVQDRNAGLLARMRNWSSCKNVGQSSGFGLQREGD
mmetsp:Transcript_29836/g.62765  ORF Transcript_29836/g.62765 Transcript_29836/m.62765 type:complete len:455 (+) Transcript_29836:93-1457(+)|eukprot:CAMPEP_0171334926 /NCGR_PEP_ID=MMETSP0878-20121228/5015_1 /TAXON_ID=67004 /ORGANISM="Thalassiosira weissflogii, Strain CCMP1336" /LENGTH=454 /DNA_ID=CAMNT_0011836133 /DNA_START=63 /DNA_END=1427 /DNA_ORIENTATION=+